MTLHSPSRRSSKRNIPALGERVDLRFLALLLGVTRQHASRLCRAGKVPGAYQSQGGHWRARWSAQLHNWVKVNQTFKTVSREARGRAWAQVWDEWCAGREAIHLLAARDSKLRQLIKRLEATKSIPPTAMAAFADSPMRGMDWVPPRASKL